MPDLCLVPVQKSGRTKELKYREEKKNKHKKLLMILTYDESQAVCDGGGDEGGVLRPRGVYLLQGFTRHVIDVIEL